MAFSKAGGRAQAGKFGPEYKSPQSAEQGKAKKRRLMVSAVGVTEVLFAIDRKARFCQTTIRELRHPSLAYAARFLFDVNLFEHRFRKMNGRAPNLEQTDSLLKLVDREIWLVTAAHAGKRSGLTATWISQVSLDRERPVLLAGLSPRNFTTELVQQSGTFAAHLVHHELVPLAYRLAASSGRDSDKLADVALLPAEANAPVIAAARAWFVGRVFQQLIAGDRVFFWADVIAAGESLPAEPARPLLKEQAFIQALTADERRHLKSLREADALALRPVAESWRRAGAVGPQTDSTTGKM